MYLHYAANQINGKKLFIRYFQIIHHMVRSVQNNYVVSLYFFQYQ